MSIYGYYTSAEQVKPEYDPGLDSVACPICGSNLDVLDVRTISLMVPDKVREGVDGRLSIAGDRSYFYRVHRSCHEQLSEAQRSAVDGLLVDAIYSARSTN